MPLIENGEHEGPGAKYFVGKYLREILAKDPQIDTLILGCTHYPLLKKEIDHWLSYHQEIEESEFPIPINSPQIQTIAQGELVARSLADYLNRHPEYESQLSQAAPLSASGAASPMGSCRYLTTENADRFSQSASLFLSAPVSAEHIDLE